VALLAVVVLGPRISVKSHPDSAPTTANAEMAARNILGAHCPCRAALARSQAKFATAYPTTAPVNAMTPMDATAWRRSLVRPGTKDNEPRMTARERVSAAQIGAVIKVTKTDIANAKKIAPKTPFAPPPSRTATVTQNARALKYDEAPVVRTTARSVRRPLMLDMPPNVIWPADPPDNMASRSCLVPPLSLLSCWFISGSSAFAMLRTSPKCRANPQDCGLTSPQSSGRMPQLLDRPALFVFATN